MIYGSFIVFELGMERYQSQTHDGWQSLKNEQLYPQEFVDGYQHAVELHQEWCNESRYEAGVM
jgi:hypothetical protein